MTRLPEDLIALTGVTQAECIADVPGPTGQASLGWSQEDAPDLSRILDDDVDEMFGADERIDLPDAPFKLSRLAAHPTMFWHESSGQVSILRGETRCPEPGVLLLLSGDKPVTLRDQGHLINVSGGAVTVWRLPQVGDDLEIEQAPSLSAPEWPGIQALLGGRSCASWLAARVDSRGQSVDPLTSLSAPGLLVRLWAPANAEERSQAMSDLRAGAAQPATAAGAWLQDVAWSPVLSAALPRAAGLCDTLDALADQQDRSVELARSCALGVVEDRDDMASLCVSLRLAGVDPGDLVGVLERVDRRVGHQGSLLSDLLRVDPDDPWLRAVHRHEPDHWWGALVR